MIDNFLFLSFFYGVLSLDFILIGPFMLFRPLIVGTLFGFVLGNPVVGFFIGSFVEMFWIRIVPGGMKTIDLSLISALTTAWVLSLGYKEKGTIAVSLLLAIPIGLLMRPIDFWWRQQVDRLNPLIENTLNKGKEAGLILAIILFVCFSLLKSALIFGVFYQGGFWILNQLLSLFSVKLMKGFESIGNLLPLIGISAALSYFYDRSKIRSLWGPKA